MGEEKVDNERGKMNGEKNGFQMLWCWAAESMTGCVYTRGKAEVLP